MRWILRIVVVLIVLVVVVLSGGYLWMRGSLPDTDGNHSVTGISEPVEIIRDRYGVPHIVGQTHEDAFFGLGYTHAQDRLWQMELNRRLGAGRLAEIMGADALSIDKSLRVLGIYHAAQKNYANLDTETRALLEAYAAGVNAFIATRDLVQRPLPPEFIILSIEPEPWTPADSLVWGKMMSLSLNVNMADELLRAHLLQVLNPDQVADLYPGYPHPSEHQLGAFAPIYKSLPWRSAWRAMTQRSDDANEGNGSNNWVVSGAHTATGKPLIANDPHLGLSVPAIWYFAHVSAPNLNVIGATLPGIPAILIGRNDRIAWGFTNTYGDVQDLFIERVVEGDPTRYESPGGPRPFRLREEIIHIKDSDPVRLTVRLTRHGPVVSDLMPKAHQKQMGNHVLALAWTALDDVDNTARAPFDMGRAGNWKEFTAALRQYGGPQQNMLYADVDGHIGFYSPARIPVRDTANLIRGTLPSPGWDARFDWTGYLQFEQLPHRFDPPNGKIATANNAVVDDSYPHHITYDWEHPYRIRRIDELLSARDKHSVHSFVRAQGDNVSTMAGDFLVHLIAAKPESEAGRRAVEMFKSWDGDMDLNRPEPLLFSQWYRELEELVYADELGSLFTEARRLRPMFLQRALTIRQKWCNNVTTGAADSCESLVVRALEDSLAVLGEKYGNDIAKWRWGDAHYAHMKHLPFSFVPILNRIFDLRIPSSGGPYTVNRGGYSIGNDKSPFAQVHGASFRVIYDLEDLNRSIYIHTTGQSGNPLSRFFDNFVRRWRDIEYIPMTTSRRDYAVGANGTLVLTPVL